VIEHKLAASLLLLTLVFLSACGASSSTSSTTHGTLPTATAHSTSKGATPTPQGPLFETILTGLVSTPNDVEPGYNLVTVQYGIRYRGQGLVEPPLFGKPQLTIAEGRTYDFMFQDTLSRYGYNVGFPTGLMLAPGVLFCGGAVFGDPSLPGGVATLNDPAEAVGDIPVNTHPTQMTFGNLTQPLDLTQPPHPEACSNAQVQAPQLPTSIPVGVGQQGQEFRQHGTLALSAHYVPDKQYGLVVLHLELQNMQTLDPLPLAGLRIFTLDQHANFATAYMQLGDQLCDSIDQVSAGPSQTATYNFCFSAPRQDTQLFLLEAPDGGFGAGGVGVSSVLVRL
jgi:hypothetical protein